MAVISSSRPHILIIPGAWHPASTMASFAKDLEAAGFPTTVVPTRSVGARDVTVQDDEAQAKALLQPLFDEGKDVIVLGHSYGGFVITGLINGLDKKSREAQGLSGGIIGVIYFAAFVPVEGETTFEMAGGFETPFVSADNVEETGLLGTKDPKHFFYNDIPDEVADRIAATLKGQSAAAAMSTPSAIGWRNKEYDGHRGYIHTIQDNTVPLKDQNEYIARSGVPWLEKSVDASHSAFVSKTDEVVGLVAELAVEFAKN
ncbi:Alpha/Beta hydrolase protein [Trichoderma evansii]